LFELFNPISARTYPLTGLIKEIGRANTADISLPDDKKASRNHARVEKDGEGWVIVDLSSTNGTFVNGQKIGQKKLSPGDEVRIGNTILVFRESSPEHPPAEEPTKVDISIPNLTSRLKGIFKSSKKE
jgi:pSer/pThr/pTyr-binding forkhead associated (FHA) protein